MPRDMAKFISAIRSRTLDERVEEGGEKLQIVEEAKIVDLKIKNFSEVVEMTLIELGTYSRVTYCIMKCESYPFKL